MKSEKILDIRMLWSHTLQDGRFSLMRSQNSLVRMGVNVTAVKNPWPEAFDSDEGLDGSNGHDHSSHHAPNCLSVRREQASSHPSLQITLVVLG